MPNNRIQSLTVNGVTYDIVDNTSGYITADSPALTGTPTAPTPSSGASDTQIATVKYVQDSMAGAGAGTVTSVGVANATNGGLSVSGSPITSSGTISVGHSNVLASAQTTSGIYPIKIDKNGHISEYGNAVSIPTKTSDLTNDSDFIDSQYIEDKTDYSIPVSRVGEIIAGETAIGTDSTNFPTSKAVVDYVDERVVQEIDAIDVPTKTSDLTNDSGFITTTDIPTNISSFTNDSGYLTASDIASVMTYKGTKANYAALPSSGNVTGDVWHLTDTGAEWAWDGSAWQELGTAIDLSNYATKATTLSGYGITDAKIQNGTITLGSNTITPLTSYTETDPTVPSWAKQSSKPTYTASEVGAMSTSHAANGITTAKINAWDAKSDFSGSYNDLTDKPTIPTVPTNISAFTNDSGYLTSYTETDPTVPSWAKASSKPSYALTEISGTDDLRAIEGLTGTTGLLKKTAANTWTLDTNTYLTSYTETDPTVPAWAKASSKPTYTAAEVGALPSTTAIPSKTSDLTNDSGFITGYTETDPVFSASAAAGITSTDISNWNNAVPIWNGGLMISNDGDNNGFIVEYDETQLIKAYYGGVQIHNVVTPTANTDVANKSYVDNAVPKVYSSTNTGGYLTMATLPIYDGTVV